MIKDLVSVITPCYNTGKYIHRLLDSILLQTYSYIEMFAIDDGSTDNTAEIIKSYIPKFQERGYALTYIYQPNQGQSVAINNGLKLINGEFLVWPDSDDFYDNPKAIESLKDALSKHSEEYGLARCFYTYYSIANEKVSHTKEDSNTLKQNLFEDCLFAKNEFYFPPGGYMARLCILDNCIKDREIYTEKNAGQNWQLLLPLLYNRKCVTIPEYLYGVLVRNDSHSRGQYKTYTEQREKFLSYENTIIETLKRMQNLEYNDKGKYIRQIHIKYSHLQFALAVNFGKKEIASNIRKEFQEKYNTNLRLTEIIRYYMSFIPGGIRTYNLISKTLKLL